MDEALAPLWPGITDSVWFSLLAYLVIFDLVDYALHRGQHRFHWWWALHALHHSQRQMTVWSDNRNHLLDDLLRDAALVLVAHGIGVPPGQFMLVVLLTQLLQSLSHANVRLAFGPVFGRLLVSPQFHRVHHRLADEAPRHRDRGQGMVDASALSPGPTVSAAADTGHNFAVLFPVWDILFGTADFRKQYPRTGIANQLPENGGHDYGSGFWRQQWLGLQRICAVSTRATSPTDIA